ncbi:hypothetical protein KCU95_g8134, partial [Aureobasidium melanogenum]
MEPSTSRWTTVKSFARAAWWNIKCAAILPMWRPNGKCPFDRLPGHKYYDGVIEPFVDLEPYTDNMPWQEYTVSSNPGGPAKPEREDDPEGKEDPDPEEEHEKDPDSEGEGEEDPDDDDDDDSDDDDPDDESDDDDPDDDDPDDEDTDDE